jgi:AcrR family transcriptional regulator
MPPKRREQLLDAIVDYLLENGAAGLSLRPLAAAIGTKARLLIYHFGSRDVLISSALFVLLRRIQLVFVEMQSHAALDRTLLGFWRWATDKPNEPYLRLFFEVHGLAIRDPERYGQYLRGAIDSWKELLTERLKKRRMTARQREELATLIIATVDGLLLDYLATGEKERTTRALTMFLKSLKKEE